MKQPLLNILIMKKQLFLLLLFCNVCFFSQKFSADYAATYDVQYPLYGKPNTEQFILFMNTKTKESLYKSTNQYVLDSIIGNREKTMSDLNAAMAYNTALPEIVFKKDNKFNVFEKVIDTKIGYEEEEKIDWKILKETKIYSGFKTRKAVANVYGRKWIAWYAEEVPLNYGPHKFCGLPGMIINMYDEKAEYLFTLSQFKKFSKKTLPLLPNFKNFKKYSKKDFFKIRTNVQMDLNNSGIVFQNGQERKEWLDAITKRLKNSPSIDIEFKSY